MIIIGEVCVQLMVEVVAVSGGDQLNFRGCCRICFRWSEVVG